MAAGHVLTVDIESWRVEEKSYWKMEDSPQLDGDAPDTTDPPIERRDLQSLGGRACKSKRVLNMDR